MDDTTGCIIGLAFYAYVSVCIFFLANKTGADNAWFAFVPILNIILLLSIGDRPIWLIIGFFIPIVNIGVAAYVWMGVAAARGKPAWLGLLVLIPVVNLAVIGYLAFST